MATMAAELPVFLDTNVLLTATDTRRAGHHAALGALNGRTHGQMLAVSGQVLREYLVVATRPTVENGLGIPQVDAVANVRELRARLLTLPEDEPVCDRLVQLLTEVSCTGKQVHDAQIVATMLRHGVTRLLTANCRHFRRYEAWIEVLDLGERRDS